MNEGLRRIVAFTVLATIVYVLVMAAAAAVTPDAPFSRAANAPLGVGLGAAVAYYLVYMDGADRLRDRLS